MAKRFNVDIINVESGTEYSHNYQTENHVHSLVRQMQEGDQITVTRVEDSDPRSTYPGVQIQNTSLGGI